MKKCLKWTLKFPPIFQKIETGFRLPGRVSPKPPLFNAYALQPQLQSPGWVLSVIHPKIIENRDLDTKVSSVEPPGLPRSPKWCSRGPKNAKSSHQTSQTTFFGIPNFSGQQSASQPSQPGNQQHELQHEMKAPGIRL